MNICLKAYASVCAISYEVNTVEIIGMIRCVRRVRVEDCRSGPTDESWKYNRLSEF